VSHELYYCFELLFSSYWKSKSCFKWEQDQALKDTFFLIHYKNKILKGARGVRVVPKKCRELFKWFLRNCRKWHYYIVKSSLNGFPDVCHLQEISKNDVTHALVTHSLTHRLRFRFSKKLTVVLFKFQPTFSASDLSPSMNPYLYFYIAFEKIVSLVICVCTTIKIWNKFDVACLMSKKLFLV